MGSTATGWRWCWPCWRATPASALGSADVFVNVAGGVRVDEPGADLAVALAVAGAARGVVAGNGERPIACFGEIGLTGELRSVAHPERRLAEAKKFGLEPDDHPRRRRTRRLRGAQPAGPLSRPRSRPSRRVRGPHEDARAGSAPYATPSTFKSL